MNIPALRLANQNIRERHFNDTKKLVAHMGALQAQDFPMSRWAIGLRVPDVTDMDVEMSLRSGDLVRTHIMRPTWHIVAGQDVRWIMALTSKNIKAAFAPHNKAHNIDPSMYTRANDLIIKALESDNHLTRAEVVAFLEQNGLQSASSIDSLLMMNAEIEALICNGIPRGKEQTYALLDEKVPEKGPVYSREEALCELAKRYFTSHAPATLADFHWWSGLSMPDARMGLESIKSGLKRFDVEGKTYFVQEELLDAKSDESLFLLPAFDEYCVSYKDRSAVFAPEWHGQAITNNGIFKPIIVVNGRVEGIWKRTMQKNKVIVEMTFFSTNFKADEEKLAAELAKLERFWGLAVSLK
jgi:hypothetical protein